MLNAVDESFLAALASQLPPGTLRAPEPRHLEEPRGRYLGLAGGLVCPGNTEEVALVLRAAQAARVGVVPYGGGTGLVGGQVQPEGPAPLILSLERMNRLRELDAGGNVLVAEAGCILADLQAAAAAAGVPITTEIRMAVEQLNRDRVIGVTGSAGKSTTSAMIHHLLGKVGVRSYLGGNIGGSVLDGLDEARASEWVVLELSSAMLYWLGAGVGTEGDAAWSPGVGVLTNVMPNHIDWHGSFEHYRACKARIAEGDGVAVYCAEDGAGGLAELVAGKRKHIGVSLSDADDELAASLRLPGGHNRMNAAIARATVEACTGQPAGPRSFDGFRGLAHRLEFVGEFAGVRVYNDSKSTTPEACALAVGAFEQEGTRRIHLICGGYDKGVDLGGMVRAASGCASVATIGATGARLAREITGAGGRAEFVQTLDKAVAWVGQRAKPGEIVLLSPGCASWDQFAHFEERGARFASLIQGILKPD